MLEESLEGSETADRIQSRTHNIEGSSVKSTSAPTEDPSSIPSPYKTVHSYLLLRGI